MPTIKLSDRVRSFMTAEAATMLETALSAITGNLQVNGKPITNWLLDTERHQVTACLFFNPENLSDGPICPTITVDLPHDGMVASNLPSEHFWLKIKHDQLWTVADLAMTDEDTYYGLDCLLSTEAYHRVSDRLRAENPVGWRTWDRWPMRDLPPIED